MKITLVSELDYNLLLNIQKRFPTLTFQNVGYQYIDKNKFTAEDKEAFIEVTEILKKSIVGFREFNNFCHTKENKIRLRFQYNYGEEDNTTSFTGVGYILLDELHKGFDVDLHLKATVPMDDDYRTATHWLPSDRTYNVRCLNGSAHINKTRDKSKVTCTKCLDIDDSAQNRFWLNYNC